MPAIVVALATLIPAWYLLVRSTERGWAAWEATIERSAVPLLQRSLLLGATVAIACLLISLPAAWLTTRAELPGRRIWSVLLSLPLAIPSYVMGLAVVASLGPRGMLQGWLEPLGVERLPEIYGFWGATLVLTAVSYPYCYLVLRAAFRALDIHEEEASRTLGHTPWQTFLRVTLPPLVPAIAAGLLLVILYVLSDFGGVSTVRYDTFTLAIFLEYQTSFDRTAAAILGVLLTAVAVIVLAGELFARRGAAERVRVRRQSPPRPIALGRWKLPSLAFLTIVVLTAFALPVGVLLYWLARALNAGLTFPSLGEPIRNTLGLGAAGALITVILALPMSILATRFGGPLARVVEQVAYVTHALPALVVALALVFFGIRYAQGLYQTTAMLLLAYIVLFLPQALSALRSPLLRQNRHVEEAAAGLGRSPLRVLATVTVPLARPGLTAAFALVFLTTVKELPATLLLSPPGFRTLPGVIWTANADAAYGIAALPALILVVAAAIPVALLAWRGDIEASNG